VTPDRSLSQELSEGLLAHSGKLSGFPEGEHLLPVQRQRKLALELLLLAPFGKGESFYDGPGNLELEIVRSVHGTKVVFGRGSDGENSIGERNPSTTGALGSDQMPRRLSVPGRPSGA
jgi:hypothetical protein